MLADKSALERALQAIGFEVLAIVLVTPLFAWWMHTPLLAMGGLAVANCLIALLWNVVFNRHFDRWLRARGLGKAWKVRLAHALLFEGGLMLVCLPLAMWWLDLALWPALKLDIGLNLFFLPYTYLYHWSYDQLRLRLLGAI